MTRTEDDIRAALNIPSAAQYIAIFDQAAHLDWDWIMTFCGYFEEAYNHGTGVNGIFLEALSLLAQNPADSGPYYYSVCEMSYLREFVQYQAKRSSDVVKQIRNAGRSLRIVGGGITSPDNLLTSGEGFIRNYLLGQQFLASTLPESLPLKHCWIPDDFGHDSELPVVLQALGLGTVVFARLPGTDTMAWNPTLKHELLQNGVDFIWRASDGSQVLAHWLQGGYSQGNSLVNCYTPLNEISSYLAGNNVNGSPVPPYSAAVTNYIFVPIDDDFTKPVRNLLSVLENWNQTADSDYGYQNTGVWAVMASFDDFASLVAFHAAKLKQRSFAPTPYWTGHYMSRPGLKIMHYGTTRALLATEVLGLLGKGDFSFWTRVAEAWNNFAPSTHHDYVCGTASDEVYNGEQMPLLTHASNQAAELLRTAINTLSHRVASMPQEGETPVVVANPVGAGFNGLVELCAPIPEGINGIRLGSTVAPVQLTFEGGLVFISSAPSLGYTTGYLTTQKGRIASEAVISTPDNGQSYVLSNDQLTVTVRAVANWGITSMTDRDGNPVLDPKATGNDLVFYQDSGDIYQFGNEYASDNRTFVRQQVSYGPNSAEVLEYGPLRVRLRTSVQAVGGLPSVETYIKEYCLVASEPFLRMTTTGAAPATSNPGFSIMTAFPLTRQVDGITHGTANHWTTAQPLSNWPLPIFRATHHFVLPQAGSTALAAIYHPEVPAWGFDQDGVLLGCLLRNTPGTRHDRGATGSDSAPHTLRYALRVGHGLADPSTGQPLRESLGYTRPAIACISANSICTLPESYSLAAVDGGKAIITAAKPGDVTPNALILRVYQPTNQPQTLTITLGAGKPAQVSIVTALENPVPEGPGLIAAGSEFTFEANAALTTIRIMTDR